MPASRRMTPARVSIDLKSVFLFFRVNINYSDSFINSARSTLFCSPMPRLDFASLQLSQPWWEPIEIRLDALYARAKTWPEPGMQVNPADKECLKPGEHEHTGRKIHTPLRPAVKRWASGWPIFSSGAPLSSGGRWNFVNFERGVLTDDDRTSSPPRQDDFRSLPCPR